MEKSGNVQIAVYDSNGASVYQYEGENFDKGEHWIEFKADKLCSGIYYYEINVSNTHKKGKMVYLK